MWQLQKSWAMILPCLFTIPGAFSMQWFFSSQFTSISLFLPISKRHFSAKSHQFHYFCKGLPCRFFREGPLTSLNVWKDWFGASLHLPLHSPVQWMRFSIWRWKYQDCCNNDFCFSDHSTFNQTSKDAYNAQNDPFAVKKITLYQKSYGN